MYLTKKAHLAKSALAAGDAQQQPRKHHTRRFGHTCYKPIVVLVDGRTQPVVGWGHYTGGVNDKGRPVETLNGKGTPGPQYQLDK